jgi:regulator of replication initiation timing
MRAIAKIVPVCALAAVFAVPASGQNAAPASDKDGIKQAGPPSMRYRFSHVGDGVMRLDGQTGQVLMCKSQAGAWICNVVPEQGSVLPAQLKQAEADNGKLSEQLSELQRQLAIPDEERAALKSGLEKLQGDNAALRDEIASLRQDIAGLKQQMPAATAGEAIKGEVVGLRKANEALSNELASLRKELAALKTAQPTDTERDAQRAQISTLQSENAQLKDRLVDLQLESTMMQSKLAELTPPPPPPVPPAPVPAPKANADKPELKLPSREDMEQARAALVDAWRRVVEMMQDLRKDLTGENKKDAPVRL